MTTVTEKETLTEERRLKISRGIKRFKMRMLRNMPFFGDIMMRLPMMEDHSIPTACTNGTIIKYSPLFFDTLTEGQRNYVILHEVMHVLLLHPVRRGPRIPYLWNVACDYMVNDILDRMGYDIREYDIPFERPEIGCFNNSFARNMPAETVYTQLVKENKGKNKDGLKFFGSLVKVICSDLEEDEEQIAGKIEEFVGKLLENAKKLAMGGKGYYIPRELMELRLTQSKRLPWNTLLINYLREREDEESSYMTPERKYIHMDMIVPGCGTVDDELGDIWAFIDSSGSIEEAQMQQFITQLYRIAKKFHCRFNIAFWDVHVSDIYRNVSTADQLLNCIPRSTGGTDINCIYTFIQQERIKPELMLILTDGYFGEPVIKIGNLKKRTILVLTEDCCRSQNYDEIGRSAVL